MSAPEQPTPEARKAAREIRREVILWLRQENPHDVLADKIAIALDRFAAQRAAEAVEQPTGPLYRHYRRGTVYEPIGNARVQCPAEHPLRDDETVLLYRDVNSGDYGVRRYSEFYDGRFEKIADAPPATAATPPPGDAGERAREMVARWEHGSEEHRQWLRDMCVPEIAAALQSECTAAASQRDEAVNQVWALRQQISELTAAASQARREAIEECARIVEAQDGMQGWKRRIVVAIRALATPRESAS